MSLYSDYINANYDPDDYEEPENRCRCGAFTCKSPRVTEKEDGPDFILETLDSTCKKCGRGECEQYLRTPWGSIEVDMLRDGEGGWITDRAEIERIARRGNPHLWPKCGYCSEIFRWTPEVSGWRVNDRPTCWNCYSQFCENTQADAESVPPPRSHEWQSESNQ
jgi:hypothetical protein